MIEEADEAEFWLDMLATHVSATASTATTLEDEAAQLRAIFARSRTTVLERLQRNRKNRPDEQDEV